MKKIFIKLIALFILFIVPFTFISCKSSDVEEIISDNVIDYVQSKEDKISKALTTGDTYLKEGNYDEAANNYKNALSMDISNRDIYIKIKDSYIEANKINDAYKIIELAIDNNVDTDNMSQLLKDIENKFEVIYLYESVYEGDYYQLPAEVYTKINDSDISIPVSWDMNSVDTSVPGEFTYTGINKDNCKTVKLVLTINPNVYDEEIGFVTNLYENNNKLYVELDLVIFLRGEEALQEAIKRNDPNVATEDNGHMWIPDGYLIINDYPYKTTYQVSRDATFALCCYDVNKECPDGNSATTTPVSYSEFNDYFIKNKNSNSRALLCVIKMKNGVIYEISKQFTP